MPDGSFVRRLGSHSWARGGRSRSAASRKNARASLHPASKLSSPSPGGRKSSNVHDHIDPREWIPYCMYGSLQLGVLGNFVLGEVPFCPKT